MKDNLPCAVVRDLLPIYVEGLTEPETNAAVEAHLKTCPACTARLAAMRAPEPPPEAETAKEVDYLKKVKRRSWKRVVLAVLVTVLVLMGALAAKLFLLGSAAGPESMVFYVEQSDETLSLRISSTQAAISSWLTPMGRRQSTTASQQSGTILWRVPPCIRPILVVT